jgi:hypothetical protein
MVKSRFKISAYFSLFFLLAFFALSIFLLSSPHLTIKTRNGGSGSALGLGFAFLAGSLLLFYGIGKIFYLVKIDLNSISIQGVFKRKRIEEPEIKSIDLFSFQNLYWATGATTIATKIELENGDHFIIADPIYKNSNAIKQALSDNFTKKIRHYHKADASRLTQIVQEDDLEKFVGNPYTSLNAILFAGLTLLFIIPVLSMANLRPIHLLVLFFILIFYLIFGSQLNYFLVSNKRLIIKNHFFPWKNKVYAIDEIIHANFESPHKRSDALRITTRDFKTKLYSAGSLRQRHWAGLKAKLKSYHIHFT